MWNVMECDRSKERERKTKEERNVPSSQLLQPKLSPRLKEKREYVPMS